MTCRELIMYILINGLEDEQVFANGRLVGFDTIDEYAVRHGVGSATVEAWIKLGRIDHLKIGDTIYIPLFPASSL